jgi:L-ascorbate metabolism protein UlaG (beta-lactamase superfamily)
MRLDYLAHSCFLLQHEGFRVLFDPYDPTLGYPAPRVYDPDLIVVSHDHHDHNAVGQVSGRATVVRGIARRSYGPLTLGGSVGWHDDGEGAEPVSLTLLEWAGRKLAHFGDLGCELEPEQVEQFAALDLLLMPCGGDYTLDGKRAAAVVERLRPRLVVPMHYATPFLNRAQFPNLESADSFLTACRKFARVVSDRQGQADLEQQWSASQPGEVVVLHLQHQMA